MPGNIAYCVSKGGMRMLARTAGVELGEHDIRVVNIGPGAVATICTGPASAGANRSANGARSPGAAWVSSSSNWSTTSSRRVRRGPGPASSKSLASSASPPSSSRRRMSAVDQPIQSWWAVAASPGSTSLPAGFPAGSPAPSPSRVRRPSPAADRPAPATTSRTLTGPPPTAPHLRRARPGIAIGSQADRPLGCGRRTPGAGRCRTGANRETAGGHPATPTRQRRRAAATPPPAVPGPHRSPSPRRPAAPPPAADDLPRVRPAPAAGGFPGSARSPARPCTRRTRGHTHLLHIPAVAGDIH
jgi:short chain dehydrogenase